MDLDAAIRQLLQTDRQPLLIAIDGRCATGKTTLCAQLADRYDCNIFHMDDFFLRPHQRTPERLAEPGGNVDHERFLNEVLLPLSRGETVAYRPWQCWTQSFGVVQHIAPKRLNLIEGAYALHPTLREYYDLRVVLTAPLETRLARLRAREGEDFDDFPRKWIPLEDAYFQHTAVEAAAHLVIDTL